jgi:O-antigen ligase
MILFIFLSQQNDLIFPKLPNTSLNILLLILFLLVVNTYIHDVPLFSFENVRRLMFWGLAFFFFNFFTLEKKEAFQKITTLIHFVAGIFLMGAFGEYIFISPHVDPSFTFGNVAHSAEFIGFCLAFQFGSLVRLWKQSQSSIPLELLSALSLAYIFFSQSRIAVIGTVLILAAIFLLNKKYIKKIIKTVVVSTIFIIAIKFFIIPFLHTDMLHKSDFFMRKSYSVRWLLYTNTLKMIFANPLGVGIGNYEFSSIPYLKMVPEFDEESLFNTPHSDFLHFLAEDGVILSTLFFSLGISLIYFLWNDIKKIFSSYPEFIFFSLMLFVFSLLQFALLNPVPYFMTALMIGWFFALRVDQELIYKLNYRLKYFLMSLNTIALIVVSIHFYEKYASYNFRKNQTLSKFACAVESRSWLSCLNVAATYMDKGEYDKAEPYIVRVLHRQPTNYQGLRMLGFSALYQGDKKKACTLFKESNSFFREPIVLHDVMEGECSSLL